jgi:hypothetical protein
MPLAYELNKKHIYKWRESNRERLNELSRNYQKQKYIIIKEYLKVCRDFRKLSPEIFQ